MSPTNIRLWTGARPTLHRCKQTHPECGAQCTLDYHTVSRPTHIAVCGSVPVRWETVG